MVPQLYMIGFVFSRLYNSVVDGICELLVSVVHFNFTYKFEMSIEDEVALRMNLSSFSWQPLIFGEFAPLFI